MSIIYVLPIVGAIVFYMGFRLVRRRRLIMALPTSKCRSVSMGIAEICGEAKVIAKLTSPITSKECVYWRYTIEEYRKQGKSSRWVTLKQAKQEQKFLIDDGTGQVMVDPTGAEIDIPADHVFESGTFRNPPEHVAKFLNDNGISPTTFFGFNRKMRCTEYYIAPKDKLFVIGIAGDNPDVAYSAKGYENVLMAKGRQFLYISDSGEKQILKKLFWQSMAGVMGGSIILVIGLGGILLLNMS